MSYENPSLPEDVNVSRDNALTEFLRLAAGLAAVVAIASAALYFGGSFTARHVPFEMEKRLVGDLVLGLESPVADDSASAVVSYLEQVTDRLAMQMDLPTVMKLRVHYIDTDVPNAFATLGGHIAVTRGLYEVLESENELALVLAHEIAHIRARDPISSLGGSATLMTVLALASGDAGSLSTAFATVVQRGYSRRAEADADEAAVRALRRVYGHAGGVADFFATLASHRGEGLGDDAAWLLSTHPMDAQRTARLRAAAGDWDARTQPLLPIAVPAAKAAEGGADRGGQRRKYHPRH